jgi:rifampin ADP-ribosylating transferase
LIHASDAVHAGRENCMTEDPHWTAVTFDNCNGVAGPFYHGTAAELRPGDLLVPGFESNYQKGRISNHIYFTSMVASLAAQVAAALAGSEGRGHVYLVEPTGPFEDDPNVTNKRFRGNPTKSYRSKHALRVVREVEDWEEHGPEVIQRIVDGVAALKAQGRDLIED